MACAELRVAGCTVTAGLLDYDMPLRPGTGYKWAVKSRRGMAGEVLRSRWLPDTDARRCGELHQYAPPVAGGTEALLL